MTTNLPALNISALAREHGCSRTTIRRRLASGWQPANFPGAGTVEIMPPSRPSTPWTATVLIIVAFTIAALALLVNGQQGFSFGTTPLAKATFAGLSVGADLLAFVLPATACLLWHRHRPWLAATAWAVFAAVASLAILQTIGFAERNLSDTAAGRAAVVTTATVTADQYKAGLQAAQLAASTATAQRQAECVKRGPLCRERESDERQALTALRSALAQPLPTLSAIGVADPQVVGASRLASWVGLSVTKDDVVNLRLSLLVLIPNIAGLVLAFGVALRRTDD